VVEALLAHAGVLGETVDLEHEPAVDRGPPISTTGSQLPNPMASPIATA